MGLNLDFLGANKLIAKGLDKVGLDGAGQFLGQLEDPFQLHKAGLPNASPWTQMQEDEQKNQDLQAKKALSFSNAFNT